MNHKKIPFSQAIVILAVIIAVCFIIWSCIEMHRLGDLSPIAYIGTSIIGMFAAVVSGYMWRAKQSDLYELEIKKAQILGKKHKVPCVSENENELDTVEEWGGGDEE